jgi:hypothetical protein
MKRRYTKTHFRLLPEVVKQSFIDRYYFGKSPEHGWLRFSWKPDRTVESYVDYVKNRNDDWFVGWPGVSAD